MSLSNLSFLSDAEKITFLAYQNPRKSSIAASEILSRLAAFTLLSPAAALDITIHGSLLLPTFAYAIGKSIYHRQMDCSLPWQHLQRVRNAVSPLLLGSACGILHPFFGLAVSEPTDKQAVLGMLTSNIKRDWKTICSPVDSLSVIENIAKNYPIDKDAQKIIFSPEDISLIQNAKNLEKSLEALQAQELVYKITNFTLLVMNHIDHAIKNSCLKPLKKEILIRLSGSLIPALTIIDVALIALTQTFFMLIGLTRLISGRGPVYTEVTTNPLMHASFLIQNILKCVGNLIGTAVWFYSPEMGFKASLMPAHYFFKIQMHMFNFQLKLKMHFAKESSLLAIPILLDKGGQFQTFIPSENMHMTYLVVEKKNAKFNLYWVNRPNIWHSQELDLGSALNQIQLLVNRRFTFTDTKKILGYSCKEDPPKLQNSTSFNRIVGQGAATNCVVSNLFGMLEAIDLIKDDNNLSLADLRHATVRKALAKDYSFYANAFYPLTNHSQNYSIKQTWDSLTNLVDVPI